MYNLGCYPGIVRDDNSSIYGEVYEIKYSDLPRLDSLEGNGYLYNRSAVIIKHPNGTKKIAYTYVYANSVEGKEKINFFSSNKDDYVWYACYGSNLCHERFMCYITGKGNTKYNISTRALP